MKLRRALPIILMIFPYLIVLVPLLIKSVAPEEAEWAMVFLNGFFESYLFLTAAVYILNIWNALTFRGENSGRELVIWNMIIKLIHIPFYLGVFAIGFGFMIAIAVPALTLFSPIIAITLAVVDFFLMVTSSMYGLSAIVRLVKRGEISVPSAIVCGLMHFVFVLDVISSVVLCVKTRKRKGSIEI